MFKTIRKNSIKKIQALLSQTTVIGLFENQSKSEVSSISFDSAMSFVKDPENYDDLSVSVSYYGSGYSQGADETKPLAMKISAWGKLILCVFKDTDVEELSYRRLKSIIEEVKEEEMKKETEITKEQLSFAGCIEDQIIPEPEDEMNPFEDEWRMGKNGNYLIQMDQGVAVEVKEFDHSLSMDIVLSFGSEAQKELIYAMQLIKCNVAYMCINSRELMYVIKNFSLEDTVAEAEKSLSSYRRTLIQNGSKMYVLSWHYYGGLDTRKKDLLGFFDSDKDVKKAVEEKRIGHSPFDCVEIYSFSERDINKLSRELGYDILLHLDNPRKWVDDKGLYSRLCQSSTILSILKIMSKLSDRQDRAYRKYQKVLKRTFSQQNFLTFGEELASHFGSYGSDLYSGLTNPIPWCVGNGVGWFKAPSYDSILLQVFHMMHEINYNYFSNIYLDSTHKYLCNIVSVMIEEGFSKEFIEQCLVNEHVERERLHLKDELKAEKDSGYVYCPKNGLKKK